MKDLAIVICNYNKKDYVLECIGSVLNSSFSGYDLIVVDNASTDGSAEAIQEKYGSELTLLVNEENTGGAGGFNRGMQYTMVGGSYKYICLLDNDVVVDNPALDELHRFMESNPNAGACGALVCYYSNPEWSPEFGAVVDTQQFGVKLLHKQIHVKAAPEKVDCDFVPACAAIFRVDALRESGIMNPDYFIAWDDIELGKMIRLAGYTVHMISAAKVWHHFEYRLPSAYYALRNKIYYFTKFMTDEEFEVFPEMLTKRLFRSIAVNRQSQVAVAAYMHGLNDGLNGIMGRASEGKIMPFSPSIERLYGHVATKKNILLIADAGNNTLIQFLHALRDKNNDAAISIAASGLRLGDIENAVKVIEADDDYSTYDQVIKSCYHVLDEKNYDRSRIYVDNYFNVIMDEADFDYYENLDSNYESFHGIFYAYIKSKLAALRKEFAVGTGK